MQRSRRGGLAGRRQKSVVQGDLQLSQLMTRSAFIHMGTYAPAVYFHKGSLLPAPRRPHLRIRRRLRRCHRRRHIAEGCAVKYIGGNQRAQCAARGQRTVLRCGGGSEIRPSYKDAGLRESRDRLRARNGLCAVGPACCCRGRFRNLLCRLARVRTTEAEATRCPYSRPFAASSSSY